MCFVYLKDGQITESGYTRTAAVGVDLDALNFYMSYFTLNTYFLLVRYRFLNCLFYVINIKTSSEPGDPDMMV